MTLTAHDITILSALILLAAVVASTVITLTIRDRLQRDIDGLRHYTVLSNQSHRIRHNELQEQIGYLERDHQGTTNDDHMALWDAIQSH